MFQSIMRLVLGLSLLTMAPWFQGSAYADHHKNHKAKTESCCKETSDCCECSCKGKGDCSKGCEKSECCKDKKGCEKSAKLSKEKMNSKSETSEKDCSSCKRQKKSKR